MSVDRYQLIDFGAGKKLESLAGHRIVRPSPAAAGCLPRDPEAWRDIAAVYDSEARQWTHHRTWPEELTIDCGTFRMPVRPTPHGHIGLFPEQADNWDWLAATGPPTESSGQALNLFAYTGASTLALVGAGFQVAHVDAAKPNVQAAGDAARCNPIEHPPIRFLVDDAARFAAREVRRGRRYHTIVMDPPAYGHAPSGRAWRLERDLWPLLDDCLKLLDPRCFRLLITGHSPEVTEQDVITYLIQSGFLGRRDAGLLLRSGRSQLQDLAGRRLDAGFFVRVAR